MAKTYDTFDGETCELIASNVTIEEMFPDAADQEIALEELAANDGHYACGGGAEPFILIREHI